LGNFFCFSGDVLLHPFAEPTPTAFPSIGLLQSRDLRDSLCLTLEKILLMAIPLGGCGSVSSRVLDVNMSAFYVLDDISFFREVRLFHLPYDSRHVDTEKLTHCERKSNYSGTKVKTQGQFNLCHFCSW
jgi:hypothetical protein